MNKYIKLANINTNYAMRMKRLSNRIVGEVARPTNQKSMKVMKLFSEKPIQKRSEIVEYYPRIKETETIMDHLRDYGLYRNEHKDFKEEYDRLRALRGKEKWIIPKYRNQKKDES